MPNFSARTYDLSLVIVGQTPGLHSGAVPNDPASSSSHGGGQDPSFEGRSQQELTQVCHTVCNCSRLPFLTADWLRLISVGSRLLQCNLQGQSKILLRQVGCTIADPVWQASPYRHEHCISLESMRPVRRVEGRGVPTPPQTPALTQRGPAQQLEQVLLGQQQEQPQAARLQQQLLTPRSQTLSSSQSTRPSRRRPSSAPTIWTLTRQPQALHRSSRDLQRPAAPQPRQAQPGPLSPVTRSPCPRPRMQARHAC